MSTQYLDKTGLSYFWGKIKAYVDAHGGNVDSTLGDVTFTKKNGDNVVNVSGWGNATISSSAYTSIGTLPEEFRPTDTRFVPALCGNAITYNAIMRILPSGDVSLLSGTSITNQFFAIGGSYIIV